MSINLLKAKKAIDIFNNLKPYDLLLKSIKNNYIKGIEHALKNNAKLDHNCWQYALENGNINLIKYILHKYPNFDKNEGARRAISYRNFKLLKFFLENGADINSIHEAHSLLDRAQIVSNKKIINYLIKKGAKYNIYSNLYK